MHDAREAGLRRSRNQIIAGVCAGLGEYFRVDPVIVRLIFVVITFLPPVGPLTIVIYLALWLLMPPAESSASASAGLGANLRSMRDDVQRMGEDVRRAFSGSGAPPPPVPAGGDPSPLPPPETFRPGNGRHSAAIWLGGLLVLIGLIALLRNLGLLDWLGWDLFWPLLLIGLGVVIVLQRLRSHA